MLQLRELPTPTPGPGEALVQIEACGVNFIDIYLREGRYASPLPFIPGQEAAGVVVGSWAGCQQRQNWRPRRLVRRSRDLRSVRGCAGRSPDCNPRRRLHAPGRRRDAARNDGALSRALDLCHSGRRRGAGPRRRGRRRTASHPDGQAAGRARLRHRLHRREGRAGACRRGRRSGPLHARRLRREGARVTTARAFPWSTTRSARPPSTAAWPACARAASSSSTADRAARCPPFDLIQLSARGSLYITRPTLKDYTATREELAACARAMSSAGSPTAASSCASNTATAGRCCPGPPRPGVPQDHRQAPPDSNPVSQGE